MSQLRTLFHHRKGPRQKRSLQQQLSERNEELRLARVELAALRAHLPDHERIRSFAEMVEGVVHDFNNSLMSVIGYTSLLIEEPSIRNSDETLSQFLSFINSAGHAATQVAEKLPGFYKELNAMHVFEQLDFNKVVAGVAQFTQPKWKSEALAHGQSIKMHLELEKLPLMNGNLSELQEVITNLIFNAVEAMPQGGTITLKTLLASGGIDFSVSDDGNGMLPAMRAHCLEPFLNENSVASGFGFSRICGIIKNHGGRIEIESKLEQGTTVRIFLPSEEISVAALCTSAPEATCPLEILGIDDEDHSRPIVSRHLTGDGQAALAVSDPEIAIAQFEKTHLDLLTTEA